jgi:serine/threonine-protein kinase
MFVLQRSREGDRLRRVRLVDEPPSDDTAIAVRRECIAPEQWEARATPASDVYSLGCTLYELATGVPPFAGSLPELMLAHVEQRPARPSWLRAMPIELERLILRALAKRPEERPTMRELAYELAELAAAGALQELRAAG